MAKKVFKVKGHDQTKCYNGRDMYFDGMVSRLTCLTIIIKNNKNNTNKVGRRLSAATCDAHETPFLFQRISVALQWFNAVRIHESFVVHDVEPDL